MLAARKSQIERCIIHFVVCMQRPIEIFIVHSSEFRLEIRFMAEEAIFLWFDIYPPQVECTPSPRCYAFLYHREQCMVSHGHHYSYLMRHLRCIERGSCTNSEYAQFTP